MLFPRNYPIRIFPILVDGMHYIPIIHRRVIVGSYSLAFARDPFSGLFLFVLDEKTFTRTLSNSDNRNLEGIQTGEKINQRD